MPLSLPSPGFDQSDRHLSGIPIARDLTRPTRPIIPHGVRDPRGPRGKNGTVWPCTPRGLPGRPRRRERRWALTPPFHPSPVPERSHTKRSHTICQAIGWSTLCCTCRRPGKVIRPFGTPPLLAGRGALRCSDFPPRSRRGDDPVCTHRTYAPTDLKLPNEKLSVSKTFKERLNNIAAYLNIRFNQS